MYTRTGRPFFGAPLDAALLARVRAAATAAGLWAELDTDWLLLDTELLPWSAKAAGLIREQYASVGAAGRAVLPAVLDALDAAAGRGLPVDGLRGRMARRSADLDRLHRRLPGLRAPDGRTRRGDARPVRGAGQRGRDAHRPGSRLAPGAGRPAVAADPGFFTPTRRRVVDLADPAAVAAATDWWLALTAAGGEGMVVKPYAGLAAVDQRGRLRPAGGEVPGPGVPADHLRPGVHRAGAAGRAAQAVARAASAAWRCASTASAWPRWTGWPTAHRCGGVHELVFAILACESEPVDPRL